MAAFGTRGLVRFAHWKGRREMREIAEKPDPRVFRGLIQINIIRP